MEAASLDHSGRVQQCNGLLGCSAEVQTKVHWDCTLGKLAKPIMEEFSSIARRNGSMILLLVFVVLCLLEVRPPSSLA